MVAEFYLEKNMKLNAAFACLVVEDVTYRFRISDKVVSFISMRRDAGNDYVLRLQYEDGTIEEEYWEFGYLFGKYGLNTAILGRIEDIKLTEKRVAEKSDIALMISIDS